MADLAGGPQAVVLVVLGKAIGIEPVADAPGGPSHRQGGRPRQRDTRELQERHVVGVVRFLDPGCRSLSGCRRDDLDGVSQGGIGALDDVLVRQDQTLVGSDETGADGTTVLAVQDADGASDRRIRPAIHCACQTSRIV